MRENFKEGTEIPIKDKIICKGCKNQTTKDLDIRGNFCSKDCHRVWHKEYKRGYTPPVRTKTCKECSKPFETTDRRNNFCSALCKNTASNKTLLARTGFDNPNKLPKTEARVKEIKQVKKAAMKDMWDKRYKEVLTIRNNNNLSKYGTKNTFNLPHSKKKRAKTLREKYHTDSPRLAKELIKLNLNYTEMANIFLDFLKKYKQTPFSIQAQEFFYERFGMGAESITSLVEKNSEIKALLNTVKSCMEQECLDFLKTITDKDIKVNLRPKFMEGLELDFWIPEYNVAIELHGLKCHSERPLYGPKDLEKVKYQHERKHLLCKKQGITLIQIFEDEWLRKRDLVKAMIVNKLGFSAIKIGARECEIVKLTSKEVEQFFKDNHLSGHTFGNLYLALKYKGEIMSALSFRIPYHKKLKEDKTIEIARFCTKAGVTIRGGFTKLLQAAESELKALGFKQILTFADARFGTGSLYRNNGFLGERKTKPNYFYENGVVRESRLTHQKDNSPESIAELGATERLQNNNAGWYAIYDAGSYVFTKPLI
jgi:hypothetical protein